MKYRLPVNTMCDVCEHTETVSVPDVVQMKDVKSMLWSCPQCEEVQTVAIEQ